jgi:ribonucleoside-diphosphate reductase alpha chain
MQINEWLPTQLGIDIWSKKYQFQNETFEEWLDRVSDGNEDLKQLIREKKFLFGVRTMSNRGTGKKASFSNCYSSGYAPDSITGIMELNKNIALTYKSQGGQGISLSKIRPKGAGVSNGQFESDGIVPFMEIFNQTTASISQGGSRKGALMMSLSCNHKEIETFINIKSNNGMIEKANLSVEIDDNFMNAVKDFYVNGNVITLYFKEDYEGNIVEYDLVPIDIYKNMMKRAYDWAEPGVILTKRFRDYNLMEYNDEYMVITGNPCGEQPLIKNGACNLGSINLSKFVRVPFSKSSYFDYTEFNNAIFIAIKALDDVLEEGKDLHALEEQRVMATNYRNIGLGIMGLGDLFIKMGIKYGSEESKNLLDKIMSFMFKTSVTASSFLARQHGSFPKYSDVIFNSNIIKKHFSKEEISILKENGLRNCSLLSIAPTGSIGTMFDITTGIEPAYQISYTRKTESLHKDKEVKYDVVLGIAQEYMNINNTDILPDYFISSYDIAWKDRIDIQAIAQNHVDTAISSTINLPQSTTIQEIEQLYLYAWEKGLKGVTIFRDGCAKLGILTNTENEELNESEEHNDLPWGTTMDCSEDLIGRKKKIVSGCGSIHVGAFFDPSDGRLMEVYINKGSLGGCMSNITSVSRLISVGLRTGVEFDTMIDQLMSAPVCPSFTVRSATRKDTSKGNSCSTAIAHALIEMKRDIDYELGVGEDDESEYIKVSDPNNKQACPECSENLKYDGGCVSCANCGFSRCD